MNLYAGQNKEVGLIAGVKIRYGQEQSAKNVWKDIIAIKNSKERHKKIDLFLTQMEQNAKDNGFFTTTEDVHINSLNSSIVRFDDKTMYYMFFDWLDKLNTAKLSQKSNISDNAIINQAIQFTLQDYFGGLGSNQEKRLELTKVQLVGDDIASSSISNLKGQNCSACLERAVMAYNLWLLTGVKSYYCYARPSECDFGSQDTQKDDAHCFTIVELDENKFRLYDMSLLNICAFQGNPIQDMINGKPIQVDGVSHKYESMGKAYYSGVYTKGVYANFPKLVNTKSLERLL